MCTPEYITVLGDDVNQGTPWNPDLGEEADLPPNLGPPPE